MEIKICNWGNNGEQLTSLYEGTEIAHRFVQYKDKEDFNERYANMTNGHIVHVLGLPEYLNNPEIKRDGDGNFLFIFFRNQDGEIENIVVKDASIYITNRGQTVDKVMVG